MRAFALMFLFVGFLSSYLLGGSLVHEHGGIQVWVEPMESPDEQLVAAKVMLTTADPDVMDIVTFTGLSITGDLQQVTLPGFDTPTPRVDTFDAEGLEKWRPYDSHILLRPSDVGGGAGAGFSGITETNDESDPYGVQGRAPLLQGNLSPKMGLGSIRMANPTDAFFVNKLEDSPNQSRDAIELAYLVGGYSLGDAPPVATLNVTLLGEGFDPNDGSGQGAFTETVISAAIPLAIPEPSGGVLAAICLVLCVLRFRCAAT